MPLIVCIGKAVGEFMRSNAALVRPQHVSKILRGLCIPIASFEGLS
jgi:hypothetical protein